MNQTAESIDTVFNAKVRGAWNLHQVSLSLSLKLDYFVIFSSVSSIVGSGGQFNYAAANSFMDALAHYRCQIDLPALSLNWGLWSDVGMGLDLLEKL